MIKNQTKLDEKGRCCGRKPITYKRSNGPEHPRGYFCHRCDRSYDLETKMQQENWAYKIIRDEFIKMFAE